ncbi:MAG TPA: site-specific integrase [Candidatus Fimimorpha faecalis]|uniref:Site-specific integrase n=1 Tax=Candidatus Fimimorpha faecalis TaxID=2840824 RepID=A0A9D1JDN8_9FIRM|nr:site-specific integrase [Candidatus Fimimorpha faecalis]
MASIRKRNNTYQITVSNGRDVQGKQQIKTKTWKPDPRKSNHQNRKELEAFAFRFEQAVREGSYLEGETITFQMFAQLWLEQHAAYHLRITTRNAYEYTIQNYLIPAFGSYKLTKLQPLSIQIFYNQLRHAKRKDGKQGTLSSSSIRKIHNILSSMLSTAVQWQLIESNPCRRISPPRQQKLNTENYFTLEQVQLFLELLDKPYFTTCPSHNRINETGKSYPVSEYQAHHTIPLQQKLFFYMALFGGFRRGELLALTWDDIDFAEKSVSITKSTISYKGKQMEDLTKNYSSMRVVTLPDSIMTMLKNYQIEQKQYKVSIGNQWIGKNYLFIQWNGKQMNLSTPYHAFKKIIKNYNDSVKDESKKLPDIPLHGLRHTSATLLISQNVDVKTVSNRLGHAQTSTTMNIYAHSLKKMDEKAADTLEQLIQRR